MSGGASSLWVSLASIVVTNIVLSGDNAVVIALAARSLPPRQRTPAIVWGSGAAILLRVLLTAVAVRLLQVPYLKLLGGLLLLYVGVQLLMDEDESESHAEGEPQTTGMLTAIKTILIADLVMSLDNVLAVAAAAHGDYLLLVLGLGLSVPLIVFGSTFLMHLMDRLPIIVTLGAALLGYLAGEMVVSDPGIRVWVGPQAEGAAVFAGTVGGCAVVAIPILWRRLGYGRRRGTSA
jgi:YjbE family integral membrane protein